MNDASPTLLAEGEELTLTVYALAYGGEGIAKHQGLVVFVPDTVPGDTVKVRILQVKKRFARAEILALVTPSPDRVEPFCPLAGRCGGCTWQHLAYSAQLKAKQGFVEGTLQHVGHLQGAPVQSPVKAAPLQHYRHKIQIPFQAGADGKVAAGFYAKQSHAVVDMDECPVQPVIGNRLFRAVRDLANEYGYQGYEEERQTGQLRHLVIRVGLQTKELLAILVTAAAEVPRLGEFAAELQQRVPELTGVVQNVNTLASNVIMGREFRPLAGRPFIYEEIRGLRYKISAESFFQVNPYQMPPLADAVLAAANFTGRETVADLFCGVGFFTLEAAQHSRMAFGIESVGPAVQDAQANKHLNNFSNVEFLAMDAAQGIDQLSAKGFQPDVVILDPPRKGCEPGCIEKIIRWQPKRVVYVSCNPVTLARDLALMKRGGFRLQGLRPVDLFPHTYHIETVAALARKTKS